MSVDAAVDSTHTGVQLAARMGYVRGMEALLEAGADPNIYGPTRDSALRFAIRSNQVRRIIIIVVIIIRVQATRPYSDPPREAGPGGSLYGGGHYMGGCVSVRKCA